MSADSTRPVIGVLGAGSMATGVAAALVRAGFSVMQWVEGRSAASVARATATGATVAHQLAPVVQGADMLLCIVPSEHAPGIARRVADTLAGTDRSPLYVEANPLSSDSMARIASVIGAAGLPLADAGIIGLPPEGDRRPLMIVAGPVDARLAALDGVVFDLMPLDGPAGTASRVKLLQCGVSKGVNLTLALMATAAERGGALDAFRAVIARTQPDLAARAERSIPWIPADVTRSQSEFAELDRELAALGLPRGVARGTSDLLDRIAASSVGHETRDSRDAGRDMAGTVRVFAAARSTATGAASPGAGFVLTLMTDDFDEAMRGAAAGVDRIGPDLETLGKSDRQNNIGTRVSVHDHTIVAALKGKVGGSDIFCRIDPVNPATGDQIDALVGMGAQSLMLPFFHTAQEVETFVRLVDGRARTTILCETAAAVFRMDEMVQVAGVDEIHVGLTDLMLSTKVGSRYELLASDTLEGICEIVHAAGKPLHLAGVARVDDETLPVSSDLTLARYAELGITGSLVTRAFARKCPTEAEFAHAVRLMRERVDYWAMAPADERRRKAGELRTLARSARAAGKPLP